MKIRNTQPKNNKYYIRKVTGGLNGAVAGEPTIKGANVLCNCVGGANGRFNEIINDPDLKGVEKAFKYQLVCNAENFIESAKAQGLKISSVPTVGGIMVWQKGATLKGSDGAGHVAVVEEIYDDGSILTSESGWNAWAWKTVRRTNDNGRWGQNSAYKFRGCIINPSIKDGKVMPTPKLTVDGIGGADTIRAMQKYFNTPQDGVLSGQCLSMKKYYPGLIAIEYGKGGSACVKKLQKWLGVTQDGVLGENTIKAWQKKLGVTADGIFGKSSVKAWQKYLNDRLYAENVEPTGPPSIIDAPTTPTEPTVPNEPIVTPIADKYKVIDVSSWQSKIDWEKVKADGVVGAIIRYADGTTIDSRFEENMVNAKKAGLHIGSYIFSRAKTKAEAEKEAERLFNACKPYGLDMPMYIDLEVAANSKYANTVAQAFLNKMAKLGGKGGVYANLNWWNNYLVDTAKNYSASPFWIAQYYDKVTHKNPKLFGMWQYSSSGKVNGISGKVDMDWCYVAYWDTDKPTEPTTEPPTTPPTTPEPTEPSDPTKTIDELAIEVLQGKWGSGDARKENLTKAGYDYDAVQNRVNEIITNRELVRYQKLDNAEAWARKIATDNTYHYKLWQSKDAKTHECPICKNYPVLAIDKSDVPSEVIKGYHGWNCIGAAWAVWHHGMGLPCKCNCHVISNAVGEQIYNAKTDAEALAIAKSHIGMDDITVIRNGKKNVSQSKWQVGDIMLTFEGDTFTHMWYYLGNGELFEATGSNGKVAHNDQVRIANSKSRTARVIIRWIGGYEFIKKPYDGEFPNTHLIKTNEEVINDTIKWLKWIANDNSFHYGHGEHAHHNGCHFCGTEAKFKEGHGIVDWDKTYCCNPFIGGGWAHGGCVPEALKMCQKCDSYDFHEGKGYDKSKLFDNLGKIAKEELKKGDVLCRGSGSSGSGHVMLYLGDGKVVHAHGGDDNIKGSESWNKSINIENLGSKKYQRVHRFNSTVDTTANIYYGEVSKRVELLQKYMQWFGYALVADGIFGTVTLECVKDMQSKLNVTVDGIVGNDTISAMKKVVK